MKKHLLEKIESPYSREHIIKAAATRVKTNNAGKAFLSAWIAHVDDQDVLVVDIHSLRDLQQENPQHITGIRMFIYEGGWASRVYTDRFSSKWITSRLSSLIGWSGWFDGYVDVNAMNSIRRFFDRPEAEDPLDLIYDFQNGVAAVRLAAAHKRITDRIDAQMALVPEIPESFQSWIEETALFRSRYIFYLYKKTTKPLDGYCTHCHQYVRVKGAKHNGSGVCPNCHSDITYKAIKKSAHVFDHVDAYLLQRTKDNRLIIRIFYVHKDYGFPKEFDLAPKYKTAKATYHERLRAIAIDDGRDFKWYEWGVFKYHGPVRWCEEWKNTPIDDTGAVYTRNLRSALKGTIFQYSGLPEFAAQCPGRNFCLIGFLKMSKKYRCLEYLAKAGFHRLVAGIVNSGGHSSFDIDTDAKRLHDALRVRKEQLPLLLSMDASWENVKCMRAFNAVGAPVTAEHLRFFADMGGYSYRRLSYCIDGTTPHKLIRYIQHVNGGKISGRALNNFLSDYDDYLSACRTVGQDISNEFVRFPKDFRAAHDARVVEAQNVLKKHLEETAKKRLSEFAPTVQKIMQKKPRRFGEYAIVCPQSGKDIRAEGEALHHCVGGYVEKVARGSTMILFVRSASDLKKPLYTMEFRDGAVAQCRGYKNSVDKPVPPIVMDFVQWFANAYQSLKASKEAKQSCA